MSTSIASENPWPAVAPGPAAALEPATGARVTPVARDKSPRTILGMLDDAALLLLIALLFPVLILLVGMPIALLVRLVKEIAQLF